MWPRESEPKAPSRGGRAAPPYRPSKVDSRGEMFVYYYGHVPGEAAEVERALLELVRDRPELGRIARREAEKLRTHFGVTGLGKAFHMDVGDPIRGPGDTRIPISWVSTGPRRLFPTLDGELVVSEIGSDLTQIVFRGSYEPPLGKVGEVIDKVLLHHLAEASVKRFVDALIADVGDRVVGASVARIGR